MINELLKANDYARPIVARILNSRGHGDSVDDVLQEALMKAYVHRAQFTCRSKLSTWYVRIAINTALMFLRANKQEFVTFDTVNEIFLSHGESPETSAYHNELEKALLKELLQLSPIRRDAMLRYLVGETSITPTQKSRLYKARQVLRRQLQGVKAAMNSKKSR
jgi:DNA-directed RNA polymerase specialized sigma subunit, sigma24 homolog